MWWFTDLDILCSSFKTTCRAADTSCRHPLKWPKYLLFESFHYNWFASTYLLTNQVYAVSFSYQRLAYAAWIVYISCVISYDTTTILKWIRLEMDQSWVSVYVPTPLNVSFVQQYLQSHISHIDQIVARQMYCLSTIDTPLIKILVPLFYYFLNHSLSKL